MQQNIIFDNRGRGDRPTSDFVWEGGERYETVGNQCYEVVLGEDKNNSSGLILNNHDFLVLKNPFYKKVEGTSNQFKFDDRLLTFNMQKKCQEEVKKFVTKSF